MKKRSFFFKEYLTHFILIVVAFALAGSVFYHQMASYALRAKQTEIDSWGENKLQKYIAKKQKLEADKKNK